MKNYLCAFSITPVQQYISKARKLRDFFAGSKILSYLASCGFKFAIESGGSAVYPTESSASVPNKFVFTFDAEADKVRGLLERVQSTVREEWLILADMSGVPREEVENYWQYAWAALPLGGKTYSETHSKLQRILAAAKLFPKKPKETRAGDRCYLCGSIALEENFEKGNFKIEKLCGVCAIKRKLPETSKLRDHPLRQLYDEERFPRTIDLSAHKYISEKQLTDKQVNELYEKAAEDIPFKERYFALLLMDGDKMGDIVNSKRGAEEHRRLSKKLALFNEKVERYFENIKHGRLIYAGGDDVCAVIPLDNVLKVAWDIRRMYLEELAGEGINGAQPTISTGLLIAHFKEALREVIKCAHEILEKLAKNQAGRDALALRLQKRSGGCRDFICKWECPNPFLNNETLLSSFDKIMQAFSGKEFSASLAYRLGQLKDALNVKGLNEERILKLFEYELRRATESKIHTSARRFAGLCVKEKEGAWGFNASAPIMARFLAYGEDES